ncbi:MAG: GntR family transcriptional regulator [Coriobacteriales bacterium]|nr:GntR family transcriptional regulator [Coriobacteriales bacterium]
MRNFEIDNESGIPVWIQVRRRLVYLIVSGHYGPGEQLPTVRELAVQLDINYNTVSKVYQDLERDGFIVTRRGRGTFVTEFDDLMLRELDNKVELLADELVREGLDFGMTGPEIVRTVQARLAQYESSRTPAGEQSSDDTDVQAKQKPTKGLRYAG